MNRMAQVALIILGIALADALPAGFQENLQRRELTPEDIKLMESLLSDEHDLLGENPLSDETGPCVDEHDSSTCAFYANKFAGYCQGHELFMKTYCRATCGFCGKIPSPTKECKDLRAACTFFATTFKGYCDYNSGFMTKNCAKACGFCKTKFPSPPLPNGGLDAHWSTGQWDKTCMGNKRERKVLCVHDENGTEVPVDEKMCELTGDKPEETEDCE